jgi:hypothetical protein
VAGAYGGATKSAHAHPYLRLCLRSKPSWRPIQTA